VKSRGERYRGERKEDKRKRIKKIESKGSVVDRTDQCRDIDRGAA
jgi:hypothetical protein